ncbi:MAG: cytochrome B [Candidatus Omnitrophica bacterium CG11_big_fil_rev_8_21_14_0_20_45_26]|uniref:Cytochrome B n=1 Tax=Candidatus Abzuiibacterium crystallinum TaxID=1974748 RepID=A0A2H0LL65_9BACT|nr:MAG: cytochrome B [Candidatus Omnitrophica bacterium CG11_big_fil_rev_8_21_14_0_20_45_26]PIW63806.1 MAG: cytochrome B [Candidatus Omnitrophica bacterium CG12_big_fil_rev_8_21_14_0_65_45_16]
MLKRLYHWVLHWAQTPHAKAALFFIAFAEASFFPVPPDLLLIAMVLSFPTKWVKYAAVCLCGSVMGGLLGYAIGYEFWHITSQWFFHHVFSEAIFDKVKGLYQTYDFWAVFVAGFTPIPYKVFTITAGVCHINLFVFTTASVLSRGGRFFLVAGLLRWFGPKIKVFLDRYFNILSFLFTFLLIGGFFLLKYLAK